MLFEARLRDGLIDGSITVAFRRWQRAQVVAGRRYCTGGRMRAEAGDPIVEADRVDIVEPHKITLADARRAGYRTREALLADLRGDPELPLYRIRFRLVDEPDPRAALAADADLHPGDVTALSARLDRLDAAAGPEQPWTAAVLAVIARYPGVVSTELAELVGLERFTFKRRVSALKRLGLTISLNTGYRLSPRGAAYLAQTQPPRPTLPP